MNTKILALASLIFVAPLLGAIPAAAQVTMQPAPIACDAIASNMHVGATDDATSGSVRALQSFLVQQGYFESANTGTGRFGPITFAAVVKFQGAHGLPTTGYVGPLTRALIAKLGCGTPTPPSSTVSLYSLSPATGTVGTSVSVTGFGFTNANTILLDGNVAARNVPIMSSIAIACTTSPSCHGGINQTIVFPVPGSLSPDCSARMACPMYMRLTSPGTYTLTVKNDNGTSNPLTFTVTEGTTTLYTL